MFMNLFILLELVIIFYLGYLFGQASFREELTEEDDFEDINYDSLTDKIVYYDYHK